MSDKPRPANAGPERVSDEDLGVAIEGSEIPPIPTHAVALNYALDLRDARTERDKWKQSYEHEQEDAHKLRERVRELEIMRDNLRESFRYESVQHYALREAVREEIGEKTLEALDEIVNTESGGGESQQNSAFVDCDKPGDDRPAASPNDSEGSPKALGQLLVRGGVPWCMRGGWPGMMTTAEMVARFPDGWEELTDSPADVPYKLAWEEACKKATALVAAPLTLDGWALPDGLYEVHRVGGCDDCHGTGKCPLDTKVICDICHGDRGRYELDLSSKGGIDAIQT